MDSDLIPFLIFAGFVVAIILRVRSRRAARGLTPEKRKRRGRRSGRSRASEAGGSEMGGGSESGGDGGGDGGGD